MIGIVVWLTAGITAAGVRRDVGMPAAGSTWIAQVARAAVGRGVLFAAFRLSSAVLLLAVASSSFQAGPGLLKALARGGGVGILPAFLSRAATATTRPTGRSSPPRPSWCGRGRPGTTPGPVLRGGDVHRVLVRARRDDPPVPPGPGRWLTAVSATGALAVGVTLAADFARGYPIVSFAAACSWAPSSTRCGSGPGARAASRKPSESQSPRASRVQQAAACRRDRFSRPGASRRGASGRIADAAAARTRDALPG
jgi:hypothetical protein